MINKLQFCEEDTIYIPQIECDDCSDITSSISNLNDRVDNVQNDIDTVEGDITGINLNLTQISDTADGAASSAATAIAKANGLNQYYETAFDQQINIASGSSPLLNVCAIEFSTPGVYLIQLAGYFESQIGTLPLMAFRSGLSRATADQSWVSDEGYTLWDDGPYMGQTGTNSYSVQNMSGINHTCIINAAATEDMTRLLRIKCSFTAGSILGVIKWHFHIVKLASNPEDPGVQITPVH